ncbi:MAG: hypothetical protein ACLS3Y_09870 [Collinsella sp.]
MANIIAAVISVPIVLVGIGVLRSAALRRGRRGGGSPQGARYWLEDFTR